MKLSKIKLVVNKMDQKLELVKEEFKKAEETYNDETNKCLEYVENEIIAPFCRENKLSFYAGMGTWCFYKNGKSLFFSSFKPTNKKYIKMYEFLTTELLTDHEIGELLEDFDWTESKN